MMKHEEMITLICNMFINAYVAGDRNDLDSFRSARADRDHLFDEIKELYAELEHESFEREQFENELKTEQEHRQSLYETIRKLEAEIQRLNEQRYCQADVENCKEMYDEMYDDADKFSEQDLPFPDVAVAGLGPATTEASADAEGEEV